MKINNIEIQTTTTRPRIPRSVATFDSGTSVLGNGDFGYNQRYLTRDFTFSTYDNIDAHVFDEVVIEIDKFEYHGRVIDIEHEYKTMILVLTTVKIKLQPFKYYRAVDNEKVKVGDKNTSSGTQTGVIRGSGGVYYEPIIEVYGTKSGEFTISFEGDTLKFKSCPGYLKVDCRDYYLNVYDSQGNERNDLLLSDFPRLHPGTLGVSMSAGIEIHVTGNWRDL